MGGDDDKAKIRERRARLFAMLGIGAALGACDGHPFVCLSPPPQPPSPDAGTVAVADAGTDAGSDGGIIVADREVLTGVAGDGKAGAHITVDGAPVYVAGLDSWPKELLGKRVEVTGRVVARQGLEPKPGEPPLGGIVGPYRVIEEPSWKLAE